MKLIINLALVMGVILAVLVTLPVKDGKPFFSIDDLKAILSGEKPGMRVPDVNLGGDVGSANESGGNAYRWQDKDGKWHFSDRQPEGTAEEITLTKAQTVSSNVAASADEMTAIGDELVVEEAKEVAEEDFLAE